MPQMFDWIFFAIIGLPTAFVVFDWLFDPISKLSGGQKAHRREDIR